MPDTPRWFTDFGAGHSDWYVTRFRRLAAEGADLAGEARLGDALVARGSRILDAGCGAGRTGAALHAAGHEAVGVDVDPALIAAARTDQSRTPRSGQHLGSTAVATGRRVGRQHPAAPMTGPVPGARLEPGQRAARGVDGCAPAVTRSATA